MRERKYMHPLMTLALNANTVASTCDGEILAMSTNGGMMNKPIDKGSSVEDVISKKVNGERPRDSYHYKVRATFMKLPIAYTHKAIVRSVLVSTSFSQIE